jgi:hypothetical protein
MSLRCLTVDSILFCLLLCSGFVFSAPTEAFGFLQDEPTMPNTTLDLQGRSLDKRQIFSRCGNSAISPLLAQTIQDAKDIVL